MTSSRHWACATAAPKLVVESISATIWSRVARDCRLSVDPPSAQAEVSDAASAALSITVHELSGAAVTRAQSSRSGAMFILALEADGDTLSLSVIDHGPACEEDLSNESLVRVQRLAHRLGGHLELSRAPICSATVILPIQPRPGPRH